MPANPTDMAAVVAELRAGRRWSYLDCCWEDLTVDDYRNALPGLLAERDELIRQRDAYVAMAHKMGQEVHDLATLAERTGDHGEA